MNAAKVQIEYLKRLIKGQEVIFVSGAEGKIGLSDTLAVFFIPEDQMHLAEKEGADRFNAKYVLKKFENSRKVFQDGQEHETPDGTAVRFSNEDGDCVWVLKKYLLYFEKSDMYYASFFKNPLYVTNGNMELETLILPYRIKEEELKAN